MEDSLIVLICIFAFFLIVQVILSVFQYINKDKVEAYYTKVNEVNNKNIMLLQDTIKDLKENIEFYKRQNSYLSNQYEKVFNENIILKIKVSNLKTIIEE